jgi:hypothetical protein
MAARKTVKVVAERTEICKNCRFSDFKRGEEIKCRRNPPVFVYDVATGCTAVAWPIVDADSWCGEYKCQLNS